jgi:hypothetical protein
MFVQSLVNMIAYTYEANLTDENGDKLPIEIETFIVGSSLLTEGRHELTFLALEWDADWILWCDADHVFPKDAFCRLWAHGLDVVGANYARRGKPTAPTAARIVGDTDRANLVYTTEEKAVAGEIEQVDHLGFGFCLMRAHVFDALQIHAESKGERSMMPLFEMRANPNGTGIVGEDVFFFKKVREAGFKVWCDHGLSWEVGHIHRNILTNAHANNQIEAWEQSRKSAAKRGDDAIAKKETEA